MVSAYRSLKVWKDMRGGLMSARKIFLNSHPMRDRLLARYRIDPNNVHVIHPGIDDSFFQMRSAQRGGSFRILTVSRLQSSTRRKNVDGALRAIARINDVPICYKIVGDGDDKLRLQQLAKKLGIEQKVQFLGTIAHDELLKLFRESDLFLLTPYKKWNDVEGFGIVYVEAAASGLPVLATQCGGITDAVSPNVTGELLSSSSDQAIEAGIRTMYRTHVEYDIAKMQNFASNFRWSKTTSRLFQHIGQEVA
jgi:phosphatidylinositol alpha-1,6-mannosyltransferase